MTVWRDELLTVYQIATNSPDPSTQNGAILLDERDMLIPATAACNRFPVGVAYSDERWERPAKYSFIEHAERGAIYAAARQGIATEGLTMVAAWASCADCARAIVDSGIVRLIRHSLTADYEASEKWRASIELGDIIMTEGGVEIVEVADFLGAPIVRRDGLLWKP